MADASGTVSRRERREAAERTSGGGSPTTGSIPTGSIPLARGNPGGLGGPATVGIPVERPTTQDPAIQSGLVYTSEMPTSEAAQYRRAASLAAPEPSESTLSRRDRRRIERLDHPVETWTAEEESRHTGQTPTMTPELIAQQEAAARQRAAATQAEALAATGGIPQAGVLGQQAQRAGMPLQQPQGPPGSVPPSLQHLFPPQPGQAPQGAPGGLRIPQGAQGQQPARPPQQQVAPSIDEFGRLVAPGAPAPTIPGFANPTPVSGMAAPGGTPDRPPAPQFGAQAAAFEALVAGADGQQQGPPQGKPPTTPVTQVPGAGQPSPFQPAGPYAPPGSPVAMGFDPATGQYAPIPAEGAAPGQGMVVPGTGTLRTATMTGTIRTIPGTGAIPRPVVDVQPAGGVRHFGWVQLLLLAAAAFALGIVVWNVAAYGS